MITNKRKHKLLLNRKCRDAINSHLILKGIISYELDENKLMDIKLNKEYVILTFYISGDWDSGDFGHSYNNIVFDRNGKFLEETSYLENLNKYKTSKFVKTKDDNEIIFVLFQKEIEEENNNENS